MIPEEKEKLKKELVRKIEEAKASQIKLKEGSKAVAPDNSIGRLTRMDAIQSKSMNEALLRDTEVLEEGLNNSLAKIDQDNFGICFGCKQPIAFARLMAIPETKLCVECASKSKPRR